MNPWRGERGSRQLLRALGDALAALIALTGAFLIRLRVPLPYTAGLLPPDRLSFLARDLVPIALLQLAVLYFFGFYDPPRPRTRPTPAPPSPGGGPPRPPPPERSGVGVPASARLRSLSFGEVSP